MGKPGEQRLPHEVHIKNSDNGELIAEVGCKTFVYTSVFSLIEDLSQYLSAPKETVKKYFPGDTVTFRRFGAPLPHMETI